jgi:hypothetical protein
VDNLRGYLERYAPKEAQTCRAKVEEVFKETGPSAASDGVR